MKKHNGRILIYGAGVIGCLYAVKFQSAGFEVSIFARGRRLEALRKSGLKYKEKNKIKTSDVKIIETLSNDDFYDFIFLTVRKDQAETALLAVKNNVSPTIVTMINSIEPYSNWEHICGKGKILPAFPGAGGGFEDDILNAKLTPKLIQPTTFGEIDGEKTERLIRL